MYTLYLKKGEEKRIVAGHSWVYANEVAKTDGKDKNGSLATVCDWQGRFIGKGYINHLSKILVRIFIRNDGVDDEAYYLNALSKANEMRLNLGYDNCYRMVFAEADNLPALIIDKYGDVLVMQCLSLGIDQRKQLICDCLVKLFSPVCIYERSDASVRKKEGLELKCGVLYGSLPEQVIIEENGLKMCVDVVNGQKTGYFLDQKENRYAARRYCTGEVLDCFCNSGGFSLNASARATTVYSLDVSQKALDDVMLNARLNGITNIKCVQGDVFQLLRDFRKEKRFFDAIVLDPPAFCKSAAEINDAYRGYKDVNLNAIKLVRSGGYLITCSCSHYMSSVMFEKMLAEAARESGRTVRCVETKSQAPDHPSLLSAEETHYLKFYVLNVL